MARIGNYEIVGELGRGAMGVVFRAFDPAIGRPVAIKVIRAQAFSTLEENQEAKLRFAREAAAAGRLSHPHIVTVYHLGEESDYQYLVMELVEGQSLSAAGAPAAPSACMPILRQVASGLDYAHAQGVYHRDIKPANILVDAGGSAKITDFGIARIAAQPMTRTGLTMGTPAYMAPEQVMASRVDGKADQFSLAVVAFELLTGQRPFLGPTDQGVLFAIVQGERPVAHEINPALPTAVSDVLRRALAKEPAQRFPSCAEFVSGLEASFAPPPPPSVRRFGFAGVAAGAVLGAALLAGIYAVLHTAGSGGQRGITTPVVKTESPKATPQPAPEPEATKRPAPAPLARAAGNVTVNPKDGQRYVWVPPGTFTMGCSPGDTVCAPQESPRHLVRLTQGFWLGQTEVTVEAWSRFAKSTLREMPPEPMEGRLALNPGWAQRQFPMDNISWSESKSYCAWAGGRLASEAQWEYAARAGSTESRYGPVDEIAWYAHNSGNEPINFSAVPQDQYQQRMEQNRNRMHTVATKRPNAWGLYDMLGNVNEWVSDWPSEKYYQESPEVDPAGPATGKLHMWRGGNYSREAPASRASERGLNFKDTPGARTGCRCTLYGIPATPNP